MSAPQSTLWPGPASKTRDSKVPEAGYGLIRIQSTESCTAPLAKSLAIGRIWVGAEGPGVGCDRDRGTVDEEADLGRVPLDPVAVWRADVLAREADVHVAAEAGAGLQLAGRSGWC